MTGNPAHVTESLGRVLNPKAQQPKEFRGGPGAERHCQAGCGVCPRQGRSGDCEGLCLAARALLESLKAIEVLFLVIGHWHHYQQLQRTNMLVSIPTPASMSPSSSI